MSDVSDYKLQFQTDEINVSKPGKYSMIVTAVDTSGNKETTTSTVIVQEKKYDSVQIEPTYVNGILIVNKNIHYLKIMHLWKILRQNSNCKR